MQLALSSPEITCDHCIATIRRTVDDIEGARFIHGDWQTKHFVVEVASGGLLDKVSAALEAEGYPLGEAAGPVAAGEDAQPSADWRPTYRITPTGAGADVNYDCPCSCDAGFAFDRSQAAQQPEHCCCGRTILVGRGAEARLRDSLATPDEYEFDVQTVAMPWGQPLPVALASPRNAEHGSRA